MSENVMEHQSSNKSKSINGNDFERIFTERTGLTIIPDAEKPKFTNCHGIEQIVDYDFSTIISGITYYIDVTTTFRSDRLKQKSYNALIMKTMFKTECKFYMVVKSLTENGKTKNPKLIEGIDGVMELDEFIKLIL
jgi:hypothetical protein